MREANAIMREGVYAREPIRTIGGIPVFSEPDKYIENYEKISHDHLEVMKKEGSNPWIDEDLWVEMEDSTAQLVEKYSEPGRPVLDVGVGLGRLLSRFPKLKRYGMDISLEYLEIARSKGVDVCFARVEDMPFRAEQFDLVLSTDILEHVTDLHLSCTKMLHVLKPGGVLIARVPYREDLSPYLESDYPYEFAHLRNFDEYSLRLLFERIFDCEWIESKTTGHYLQGNSRLKYRIPKGERTLMRILNRMHTSVPRMHKRLVPKFVLPIEINVVVRKK